MAKKTAEEAGEKKSYDFSQLPEDQKDALRKKAREKAEKKVLQET